MSFVPCHSLANSIKEKKQWCRFRRNQHTPTQLTQYSANHSGAVSLTTAEGGTQMGYCMYYDQFDESKAGKSEEAIYLHVKGLFSPPHQRTTARRFCVVVGPTQEERNSVTKSAAATTTTAAFVVRTSQRESLPCHKEIIHHNTPLLLPPQIGVIAP